MGPNYLFIQLSALLSRSRSGRSASRFRKRGQVSWQSLLPTRWEEELQPWHYFHYLSEVAADSPQVTGRRQTERRRVIVSGPTGASSRVAGAAAATGVFEIKGRGSVSARGGADRPDSQRLMRREGGRLWREWQDRESRQGRREGGRKWGYERKVVAPPPLHPLLCLFYQNKKIPSAPRWNPYTALLFMPFLLLI